METVIRTLARHRSEHEDVRVFCEPGAQSLGDEVPAIVVDRSQPDALIAALKAFDPDIVEFHQNVIAATKLVPHLPRAVSVSYRHNALKAPKSWLDKWRYNRRYRKIDHYIFVSESERRTFSLRFPRLQDRAHALLNAITMAPWQAAPSVRDKMIVFSGRAIPEKGVAEVCAALPQVLDAYPDWTATLLLNDWEEHRAWAEPHVVPLQKYGARVRVLHSIPLGEVQSLMKRADIALTPSTWDEPLGLTALEAHAAGVALISSGRGGLREASGPHALYVDQVSADTLSKAMIQLIENPQQRLEMAHKAQAYTAATHSPEVRASELTALRFRLASKSLV